MQLLGLILLLLGGGALAALSQRLHRNAPRWLALGVIAAAALYLLAIPVGAAEQAAWIPRFGISLILAMDGLSYAMVALTLFLGLIAIVSSWSEVNESPGFFQFNLLWTLAGVVGVFTALDLFLFFVFWEVMLVPMYFLIAIWGHEARAYAAMKFFLFTQISGLLMLFAMLTLVYLNYQASGVITFAYADLLHAEIDPGYAFLLMLGFFVAFVVKLPGVPFHTWLPDAHTQAPTAGSVILAGILLKTGAYGLLRFVVPLFPEAALDFRWPAMLLGAVSVIYGGYLAFSQSDFKRLVAYSSISHMGFVLLGVFAWNTVAVQGAVVQMVAHGFSTAALFMMAGALQQRLHTREMGQMGGLWLKAPRMGAVALFFVAASLGMPGLGNFVGEFMVLVGAFQVDVPLTIAAAIGIIIAAVYALSLMQRSFQGEPNPAVAAMPDFGFRELSVMILMMVALVWLGVYPETLLNLSAPVVAQLGFTP
ncbi:MAG: NADH-quinone oxidoreductase subunit M [Gammaproteobacteria bacterium]|nr:NADH-quinone oxidoreductase subunit M [Gammaproteobacteria bacterium]